MNPSADLPEPSDASRAPNEESRERMKDNVRQEIDAALQYALAFAYTGIDPLLLEVAGSTGLIKAIDSHDLGRDGPFLDYAKPLVEEAVRTWLRGPENQRPEHQPV